MYETLPLMEMDVDRCELIIEFHSNKHMPVVRVGPKIKKKEMLKLKKLPHNILQY